MFARLANVSLLAALLLAGSGCCCCRGWHGKDYCDCSCGECYWSEWFNDPPACHDPCDCYGNFAGHRHRPLMLAGHHEPTLASPEMDESLEQTPTPIDASPEPPVRPNARPAEPQPTPAETEISPTDTEPTIDTMPIEPSADELPSGDLPIFNNQ